MKSLIKILLLTAAISIVGFNHASAAISKTGLVGYWNMDNNDISGTTMYDKSGMGNNGTLVNSPATGQKGVIKEALSFDGGDDYVNLPDNVLKGATSFTISAWAKTPDVNFTNNIGAFSFDYGNNKGVIFRGPRTDGQVRIFLGNSAYTYTTFIAGNNIWYHYVLTHSGSVTTLYVNGVLIEAKSTKTIVCDGTWDAIGKEHIHLWKGLIDEVRIYNRALSAAEVLNNYNASKRNYK